MTRHGSRRPGDVSTEGPGGARKGPRSGDRVSSLGTRREGDVHTARPRPRPVAPEAVRLPWVVARRVGLSDEGRGVVETDDVRVDVVDVGGRRALVPGLGRTLVKIAPRDVRGRRRRRVLPPRR